MKPCVFVSTINFMLVAALSFPVKAEPTFSDAAQLWREDKDNPSYVKYQGEFVQYSNYLQLDIKDNCASRGAGRVEMYIVITARAIVESVLIDKVNAKTLCYQQANRNLPVKTPPFSPLVIKLDMQ